MSMSLPLPLNELHFIRKGFKLSPSTYNKFEYDCNLYLYHHKIIRSPADKEPSIIPVMGQFNHKISEMYTRNITKSKLFSFTSARDMIHYIVKFVPENTPSKIVPKIVPHVINFASYEYKRFTDLKNFLNDRDEAWHYYKPMAQELTFDDFNIGILFKVDCIHLIPPRFYDNAMICAKILDYKTGNVPNCSKGLKMDTAKNVLEKVPVTMTPRVESQIMFECLFLWHMGFGINEISNAIKPLYGEVLYTLDGTSVIEPVTEKKLISIFKKLNTLQWKIDNEKYYFNSWSCNKFHCDYGHVCLRSPRIGIGDKLEITRAYRENRDVASQMLIQKVNEINRTMEAIDNRIPDEDEEVEYL